MNEKCIYWACKQTIYDDNPCNKCTDKTCFKFKENKKMWDKVREILEG